MLLMHVQISDHTTKMLETYLFAQGFIESFFTARQDSVTIYIYIVNPKSNFNIKRCRCALPQSIFALTGDIV